MRYMFLLYAADEARPQPGTPEHAAEHTVWMDLTAAMADAGVLVAGDALHPATTATTVSLDGGSPVTTDGPFAETKETLGGYYVVEVADLDEALAWAARTPAARWGRVEVRPVIDLARVGS
jgi:hypothetical protein